MTNSRRRRILGEVRALKGVYGDQAVLYDDASFMWVALRNLILPEKAWSQESTDLLVCLPALYPEVPPSLIGLERQLRTPEGQRLIGSTDGRRGCSRWITVPIMLPDWRPSRDILGGDNILTVVGIAEAILADPVRYGLIGNSVEEDAHDD